MAEQQKPSWWSSVPGLLTAATGFVAALSGLVAGLNQLGVFQRDQPVARVEVTAAAPRESTPEAEEHTATATPEPQPAPAAPPVRSSTPAPRPPMPRAAAPTTRAPAHAESAATGRVTGDSTPAATTPRDTAPKRGALLPAGTVLELATALRVCAPASGSRRLTALMAAPVRLAGGTTLPAGTPAVLRIRRDQSAARVQVRLDSLVLRGSTVAVRRSDVTVPRNAAADGCLRPGARLRASLAAPVAIPGS